MQTISKNYETCHFFFLGYLHGVEKIIVNYKHLYKWFLLTSTSPLPKIIPFRVKSVGLYHFFFYVEYMNRVWSVLLHVTLISTYAHLFYFFFELFATFRNYKYPECPDISGGSAFSHDERSNEEWQPSITDRTIQMHCSEGSCFSRPSP